VPPLLDSANASQEANVNVHPIEIRAVAALEPPRPNPPPSAARRHLAIVESIVLAAIAGYFMLATVGLFIG
jgi:hypothetical protein